MDKNRISIFWENQYLKNFIEQYQLSNEFVNNHFHTFNDCYKSLEKCQNCKGLLTCSQEKVGETTNLAYDGSVYNEITYCPFYQQKLRKDKELSYFVRSDIPLNYQNVYLDNIKLLDQEIENLCLLCYDILDGKQHKGLYIYGDLGVGKTYMCIALANSLAKKNEKVAFIKANYFVNEMRKTIISNSEEYDKTINNIKKVPYLFIDDIGSETVSPFSRDDLLFNILDYRMENKLCTFFTSNLSKESLLKHYTYDKNDNSSLIRAKRLLERIDILSDNFVLKGNNKRKENIL